VGLELDFRGRLVKRLLGGSSVRPIDQVAREYASWTSSPRTIEDIRDPTIFSLPAYIAGMIRCTGPSPKRMRSDLDEVDKWRERIYQHFQADLGNAYREDDRLMQVLLKSKTVGTGVLSFPHPRICWKPLAPFEPMIDGHRKKSNKCKQQWIRELSVAQQTKPSVGTPESCLYLIERVTGHNSLWKIGIAAGAAQPGDLVCWVRAARQIVIVRMDGDWLQIVGTAVDPKDLWGEGIREQDFKSHEKLELIVDVETAYILMV
jgi:hypothetical protein